MGDSQSVTEAPEWRHFLGLGIILVAQSWYDITPSGPWDSRPFSRGVIGLIGLGLIYLSWFRYTFSMKGRIIPTLDLWKKPDSSLPLLAITGAAFVTGAWLAGNVLGDYLPEPTGLLLNLFGLMMLLQALYVWLVLFGPLAEDDPESKPYSKADLENDSESE